MFIIPTTNSWSCLPASFSMACGVPFSAFITMIGHDGDARPYNDKSIRKGFHFQECIEVAWMMGYSCTPIERYPALTHSYGASEVCPIHFNGSDAGNLARFMHYLKDTSRGVLEGIRIRPNGQKVGHATAWDGTQIYDPSGKIYSFEESDKHNFKAHTLWMLTEISHGKT